MPDKFPATGIPPRPADPETFMLKSRNAGCDPMSIGVNSKRIGTLGRVTPPKPADPE